MHVLAQQGSSSAQVAHHEPGNGGEDSIPHPVVSDGAHAAPRVPAAGGEEEEDEDDHAESDEEETTVRYQIESDPVEAPIRYEIAGSGAQDAARVIRVGSLEKMGNTGAYVSFVLAACVCSRRAFCFVYQ